VAHALAEFALERGEDFLSWRTHSNYIVALQVHSSSALEELYSRAEADELELISFREPDLDDQLTALAFVPSQEVKPYLASLRLAGTDFHAKKGCAGVRSAVNH